MTRSLTPRNLGNHRGDMTGLSAPVEQGLDDVPVPERRPLSLAWVSDEMIAETQRLWSQRYGRDISADEVVEILQNIKRFAEMLLERKCC